MWILTSDNYSIYSSELDKNYFVFSGLFFVSKLNPENIQIVTTMSGSCVRVDIAHLVITPLFTSINIKRSTKDIHPVNEWIGLCSKKIMCRRCIKS